MSPMRLIPKFKERLYILMRFVRGDKRDRASLFPIKLCLRLTAMLEILI